MIRKGIIYVANRLWLIATLYVISICLSSWLFATFEGKTFFEGVWWSCVTAPTIGYGDSFPVTFAGKVMAIVFIHFWVFVIIPMIIGNIVSSLMVDRQKFTHEEQEWMQDALKRIAEERGINLPPPPADF